MTEKNSRTGIKNRLPRVNMRAETLKRILIYSISTLLLGTAQCSFFSLLDICPRTPDLILGLILAVTLCDSERSAMALAVGAGFFIDTLGGSGLFLSPIIYFVYALIIGRLARKMLPSFPSFLLLLLPSLLYRAAVTVAMSLLTKSAALGASLLITVLLEALTTLVLCLPIYFLIKLATKILSTHKKFSF